MDINRRNLLVRAARICAAWAATPFALAQPDSSHPSAPGTTGITCFINGQAVNRTLVLEWELRRMAVVWKKLKPYATTPVSSSLNTLEMASAPPPAVIDQMRQDLLSLKLKLGSQRLKEILADELAVSKAIEQLLVGVSFGRYTLSVVDVQCDQGSAEGFVKWFAGRVQANDEPAMLAACPDHYVIETQTNGQQYVLETTGGSPLASQFDIDYSNTSGNPVALMPGLPARVGGVALDGGRMIGCAYHQFGTQPGGGFRGRLSVAFPWSTPWFMVDGHRWHLACEFSNWIEAYLRATG